MNAPQFSHNIKCQVTTLGCAMVLAVLGGCQPAPAPTSMVSTATSSPTATSTPMPTATAALIPPTATSTPTVFFKPTATPVPPGLVFAGQVLAAIANRPMDIFDYFDAPTYGVWERWYGWAQCGENSGDGSIAVRDGVMCMDTGKCGCNSIHNWRMNGNDFVLEVDVRMTKGHSSSEPKVFFHQTDDKHYFVLLLQSFSRRWQFSKMWDGKFTVLNRGSDLRPMGEFTHVRIITRGRRSAIFLDDALVAFAEDDDLDHWGHISLMCCYAQTTCEFDNVRFLNLTDVTGLP